MANHDKRGKVIDRPFSSTGQGRTWRLETIFLLIGLVYGLLFITITPPFQVADESRHFARAYQLAERTLSALTLIPTRDSLPASLVRSIRQTNYLHGKSSAKIDFDQIKALIQLPLLPNQRANYVEIPAYTVVSYLPQLIVIIPLRLAEVNAVITLYWARLAALLSWLVLTYWALRLLPVGRNLLFLIALLPMTLFQAGSLSADSVTISLSFLLTAVYFRLACQSRAVTTGHFILTGLLVMALTAAKLVYAPLLGLHLLIPIRRAGSKFQYVAAFSITGLLCAGVAYWSIFSETGVAITAPVVQSGIGPTRFPQLNFMMASPLNLIQVLFTTFRHQLVGNLFEMVGMLGWLDTSLGKSWYIIALLSLLLTALLSTDSQPVYSLNWRQKLLLLFVSGSIVLLVVIGISLDLRENPVSSLIVRGIQGRYFIPFAFLVGMLLHNYAPALRAVSRYGNLIGRMGILTAIVGLSVAYICLVRRYYY